jgi:hypothetical protein
MDRCGHPPPNSHAGQNVDRQALPADDDRPDRQEDHEFDEPLNGSREIRQSGDDDGQRDHDLDDRKAQAVAVEKLDMRSAPIHPEEENEQAACGQRTGGGRRHIPEHGSLATEQDQENDQRDGPKGAGDPERGDQPPDSLGRRAQESRDSDLRDRVAPDDEHG